MPGEFKVHPKPAARFLTRLLPVLLIFLAASAPAQEREPVRIGFMDPLSGPFASIGTSGLLQFEFAADYLFNSKGGILDGRMIEIVPLDNMQSPTETQIQFRRAVSEGLRYIFQGNSSAVANALNTAVLRHNRRNPGQEILQINYSAVDPVLTEENCSFWHFRFDAHAVMKLNILTDFIALNEEIKRVYVIGQDYSFGHVVAETSERMLNEKRPDIEIVGNEFHPIGQVKDFTPYVTKIVASGADAVITGNFGADMVSLARSIIDSGLDIPIYTFYAAYDGITATLGADGKNRIRLVHNDSGNPIPTEERKQFYRDFKAAHPDRDVTQPRLMNALSMLVQAMEETGGDDPLRSRAGAGRHAVHDAQRRGNLDAGQRSPDHSGPAHLRDDRRKYRVRRGQFRIRAVHRTLRVGGTDRDGNELRDEASATLIKEDRGLCRKFWFSPP